MYINIQVKAVIKRQGLGIFPGYYEYGPRIVLYQENKRNREPKEIPSCLIPCLLVAFTLNIKFSGPLLLEPRYDEKPRDLAKYVCYEEVSL